MCSKVNNLLTLQLLLLDLFIDETQKSQHEKVLALKKL
jgi:hypothetical protein